MIQRLLAIIVIVAVVFGGGYYAYRQLVPPPDVGVTGPVYATKAVTRGDISVGVEVVGSLNPSSGGGIQIPGYRTPEMTASYVISESFVKEGDMVQKGQLVIRLAAPDLQTQISNLQADLQSEKQALADLLNISVEQVDRVDPSRGITLQAPINGRVLGLTVREGQTLKSGEIVARVVNDAKFRLTAKLLPGELTGVKVGDPVLLSFSQFSGGVKAKVIDVNPNAMTERTSDLHDSVSVGGGSEGGDTYVFVHWVTLEGENPGLIQPGMMARVGFAKDSKTALDAHNARWLRYFAEVEGYGEEERVLSKADAIITRLFVRNMEVVKKGDPLISLAGDDAQKAIQDKMSKIRQLQQSIQQLNNQFNMLDVVSPMNGIVAYIDAMPGRQVNPGDWLGHIYTAEDMRLSTEIDDIDILMVKQGSPVTITVDAMPGKTFDGEVLHVSTMGKDMDGVTRFYVDIRVTGSGELRPGMSAKGFINAGSATGVLLVPLEAVFDEDGQSKVEVLNSDGTIRLVPIKIGLMNNRFAEVKEGLEEGELVITGSTADLLPSQRIQSKDGILPERPDQGENPPGNDGK